MNSSPTTATTNYLQLENAMLRKRLNQMLSDVDDLANMPDATPDIRLAAKLIIVSNESEPFSLN